jgi:hypothetical protein
MTDYSRIIIKRTKNGHLVEVELPGKEGEPEDYCFDTARKVMLFLKEYLQTKDVIE